MEIVLGHADHAERQDQLADGALVVRSRHGLRTPERLLIEGLPRRLRAGARVLAVCDAEAVVALAASALLPEARVSHLDLDLYDAARARRTVSENAGALAVALGGTPGAAVGAGRGVAGGGGAAGPADAGSRVDMELIAAADIPGGAPPPAGPLAEPAVPAAEPAAPAWDLILVAGPRESLLLRDLCEQAHDALAPGGRLLVAADRAQGKLVRVVKEIFGKADRQGGDRAGGELASARRAREGRASRDRSRIVEREVRGLRLRLCGRPGVFRADGIDQGTRLLIERLDVPPGGAVLDLGCGTGALGLAAGLLGGGPVTLVDSSLRAVECARRSATESGLAAVTTLARANLEDLPSGQALVLANPPYFGDFRIARAFVGAARRALAPGGRLWVVAKNAEAHEEIVAEAFGDVRVAVVDGYGLIEARR